MNTQTVTKIIFWLGFLSFLATSIPHVAWMYHVYEPDDTPLWWILSYAIAIGIDVLIAWLSFVQSERSKTTVGFTWVFIASLCLLSWYANYLYNMAHSPVSVTNLWAIEIMGGLTTTGYITPIVVSALPIFVIAYTFMLQLVNNAKHETLLEKATRLEQEKEARQRIKEVSKGKVTGFIKDTITSIAEIKSHTATTLQRATMSIEPSRIEKVIEDTSNPHKTVIESLQTQTETSLEPDVTVATILQEVLPVILPSLAETIEETTTEQVAVVTPPSYSNGHSSMKPARLERYVPRTRQ